MIAAKRLAEDQSTFKQRSDKSRTICEICSIVDGINSTPEG